MWSYFVAEMKYIRQRLIKYLPVTGLYISLMVLPKFLVLREATLKWSAEGNGYLLLRLYCGRDLLENLF